MANHSSRENGQWQLLVLMLKNITESKGITQQQIADATGFQQSNVARVFSLKYTPSLHTFLEIAKAVGVNFFFEDKDGKMDLNLLFERAMKQKTQITTKQ